MKSAPTFSCIGSLVRVLFVALATVGLARAEVATGPAAVTPVCAVSLDTVLRDAGKLAERAGATVMRVEGSSMLPYFGDGSVLVVRATEFDRLSAGGVVVYRNHLGELVAHRLETRSEAGWTVRGANNPRNDTTLVTADNLVGSVYVTFHSDARIAAGMELANALVKATPVALAASAR